MVAPSVDDLNEWSQVDFGSLGYGEDAALQRLIDQAVGYFGQITGRPVDDTMPTTMETQVEAALQRMVEITAYQNQADVLETLGDFMTISSFTAGSYSETRRSLEEIQKAKMVTGDPVLNQMLFPLLTDDMLDFWLAWWSGQNQPSFETTEVAWGMMIRGTSADPGTYTGETAGPWAL